MKCDMCGKEKLLFEASTGVCADCYDKYFNLRRKNEQLEDAIKVKDMLIEQLENQNDRLIEQRDAQEQQLALYKRALELACKKYIGVDGISYVLRYDLSDEDYFNKSDEQIQKETVDCFLDQAKKELEEQDVKD